MEGPGRPDMDQDRTGQGRHHRRGGGMVHTSVSSAQLAHVALSFIIYLIITFSSQSSFHISHAICLNLIFHKGLLHLSRLPFLHVPK